MLLPALAALWLASAAPAQNASEAPGPVTAAPVNGRCGTKGTGWTEKAIQDHIRDVFEEVWNAAGLSRAKPPLLFEPYTNADHIAKTTHLNYDDSIPDVQIVVVMSICDVARSDDELAAILAHELGHVALRHRLEIDEQAAELTKKCGGTCEEECCEKKLAETARLRESAADKKSVEYLSSGRSRFKAEAAVSAMRHAKDYRWALGDEPDALHPPRTQRARDIIEWIAKAKKEAKKP